MKKYFLPVILFFSFCKFSSAQILCIYCYDQNAPISTGVNNLVLNGSFENNTCFPWPSPTSFCPNSQYYSCAITNWTCTGGGINTLSGIIDTNWSSIAEGTKAVLFNNSICNACSPTLNDTSCLNNMDCTVGGIPLGYPVNTVAYGGTTGVSLEQTISGLVAGNTYVLEFWAGGHVGWGNKRGLFALDIGFGDTLMRCKPTAPTVNLPGIGKRFIIEFNATSSSHIIKFTSWGRISTNCTELILDDLQLYTLAELDASVPHCTVGIDFPNFENLENLVSPNPFTKELNVKTNSQELSEIIFYDLASRKLLQQTFINSVSINTAAFSKGIYFYEIRSKEGVLKKGKVVKE